MARAVKGHGFDRLASVEEARLRFLRLVPQGPLSTDRVPLGRALGRVLARSVRAAEPVPSFHRAAMDGFAVRARDTFGAYQTNPLPLRLAGESGIGRPPRGRLREGDCFRIATGAVLPPGANSVVMMEHARELTGGQVEVEAAATPWENVSRRGEDVRRGETVLPQGTRLEPQDLGMLAALGVPRVEVARRPRVAVIATGDELAEPGRARRRGQIFDANRPGVIAAVEVAGGAPLDLGIVRDRPALIGAKLRRAIAACDLVVISGGTSVGAKDFAPEVVGSIGPPGVVVHGVAMRPGYPVALGAARGVPVILLPGSPVAALLNVEEFAVPAIHKMLGQPHPWLPRGALVRARASRRIPGAQGLTTYARVVLVESSGTLRAEPLRISGSAILSSLVRGSGIVVIPPEKEGIEEDEEVEVRLLRPLTRPSQQRPRRSGPGE